MRGFRGCTRYARHRNQKIAEVDAAEPALAVGEHRVVAHTMTAMRDGSLVRLSSGELLDRYSKALNQKLDPDQLRALGERVRDLINGLGSDWLQRATTSDEAEIVPRLLFHLGTRRLANDDATGAWTYLARAADAAGTLVGLHVRSGHPAEAQVRRLWTQALAGSASLACHVAANAQDDKKETVNGQPVKDILNQAVEATRRAFEQWSWARAIPPMRKPTGPSVRFGRRFHGAAD
jgi:hypothetical protein